MGVCRSESISCATPAGLDETHLFSSITLNQSSMNPLDDLAIEPIQHPERYGVLVADRTATNLSGQRDYIQQ